LNDPLGSLLAYFVQQSVAHGAMFFASMLASWYFIQTVVKSDRKNTFGEWRAFFVIVTASVLFAGCYYILGRIILYGSLSYVTMNVNATDLLHLRDAANDQGLPEPIPNMCYQLITNRTLETERYGRYLVLFGNTGKAGQLFLWHFLSLSLGSATALTICGLFHLVPLNRGVARLVPLFSAGIVLAEGLELQIHAADVRTLPAWKGPYASIASWTNAVGILFILFLFLTYFVASKETSFSKSLHYKP